MQTPAVAKNFVQINYDEEIIKLLENKAFIISKKLILGGGSNLFFTENFNGFVVFINTKGIKIIEENEKDVLISVKAGEIWDDFVLFCCENSFYGAENLSFIPGKVGAAPIQNIGAYGAQAKDIIEKVTYIEQNTRNKVILKNKDCKFGYRNSIFKNTLKNKFIITDVTFRLSKVKNFNLAYGSLKKDTESYSEITLQNLREKIIEIRTTKLPNPEIYPNSGSFFKNPIVSQAKFVELKNNFPALVSYQAPSNCIKLAAGQLIDLCGWKGKKINNIGIHPKQALVIVNYQRSMGNEILCFSDKIIFSVYKKFGIWLEKEVNAIGENQ